MDTPLCTILAALCCPHSVSDGEWELTPCIVAPAVLTAQPLAAVLVFTSATSHLLPSSRVCKSTSWMAHAGTRKGLGRGHDKEMLGVGHLLLAPPDSSQTGKEEPE